ncbi:MAG: magnesium/cobalt transporter CorA [Verrucomicrobiae bacterium]|nr:magnesium/cobalt transporter CorA [Verrucomicrobiae bacterium]
MKEQSTLAQSASQEHSRTKRGKKTGLPPGSIVHVGDRRVSESKLELISYGESHFDLQPLTSPDDLTSLTTSNNRNWLNVVGLHDTALIEAIGRELSIHPLVLEDIVNTQQRPKAEDFEKYFYLSLRMAYVVPERNEPSLEHVSLVLLPNLVISFQEEEQDVFEPVRERIRQGKGRLRGEKADYLFYALLDAIVDHYFVVLEEVGEDIEDLDEQVLQHPNSAQLHQIHQSKKMLQRLRKAIWPLRDAVQATLRNRPHLISEKNVLFLRDVNDHLYQIIETIDSYRELLASLLEMHLSSVSNRMNQVMQVLTIMASIFVPLTFIAGLYGMNFQFMPELKWRYGYPIVVAIMTVIAGGMLVYFRKKEWI